MAIYRGSESTGTATQVFNIDGDKGDITVSNGGDTWTIDTGVVTTTKLGGDITTQGKALLDDATASDQRTTLGLGSAAVSSTTAFATAAQGVKADSALQSTDIGVSVQSYDSNLTSFVSAFTLPTVDGTTGQALVTNGTGTLSFTSAGSGSVTSVSVASANGFAGTVATETTTPAITLSTSVTGVLKGNGTAISAASAGTDYLAPASIGTTVQAYDADTAKLDVAQSWTAQQTFKELKDTVFTITDTAGFEIDPANGSIQTITLGANRTPVATNFEAGQVVLLGINDGTAFTITWTSVPVTWVKAGGTASAPTLATTGFTWVLLWEVGTTIYGIEVGKP